MLAFCVVTCVLDVAVSPHAWGLNAHGYVVFNKGGCLVGTRHAGTDIEGFVAPQRRKDDIAATVLNALAIVTVTGGALGIIYLFAALRVWREAHRR